MCHITSPPATLMWCRASDCSRLCSESQVKSSSQWALAPGPALNIHQAAPGVTVVPSPVSIYNSNGLKTRGQHLHWERMIMLDRKIARKGTKMTTEYSLFHLQHMFFYCLLSKYSPLSLSRWADLSYLDQVCSLARILEEMLMFRLENILRIWLKIGRFGSWCTYWGALKLYMSAQINTLQSYHIVARVFAPCSMPSSDTGEHYNNYPEWSSSQPIRGQDRAAVIFLSQLEVRTELQWPIRNQLPGHMITFSQLRPELAALTNQRSASRSHDHSQPIRGQD